MSIKHVDVAIVGSGFSGLAMAAYLKRSGRTDFVILERAQDVGGTWRDNSYPGCACDVPSHLYSFSFAPNPDWTSTFSPQAEIHGYLRKTARQEGLLPHIRFGSELLRASWDNKKKYWLVETLIDTFSARVLINAAGPLSTPLIPDIPGLDSFPGKVFHSAAWDHEYNLENKRIAVLGTGASSIQFVPEIQPKAKQMYIFQRTAPWVIPRADRHLTAFERSLYHHVPLAQRCMRAFIYWGRELYALPLLRASLSPLLKTIFKWRLRRQVRDPELRAKLTPDYSPGCKRILVSNDYYPAITKPNVEVIANGVARIKGSTVVSKDGTERKADVIVFGTGFQATDVAIAQRIQGLNKHTLAEHWSHGMQALHGTSIAGFPNLFFMLGPNTGLGHTSLVFMAEAQAKYIVRALDYLDKNGKNTCEAMRKSEDNWTRRIQKRMKRTVWVAGGCKSWYLDAQGHNTTLWPDFTFRFHRALARFDPSEYHFS